MTLANNYQSPSAETLQATVIVNDICTSLQRTSAELDGGTPYLMQPPVMSTAYNPSFDGTQWLCQGQLDVANLQFGDMASHQNQAIYPNTWDESPWTIHNPDGCVNDPSTSNWSQMPTYPTLPSVTPPLPTSYAHLEPTFTRRLLRSIYQTAYHLLVTPSQISPADLSRMFGFCLRHNIKTAIISKLAVTLGLGSGGVMLLDQLRWGLIPDRRDTEPETWMEVGDIEVFLNGKGWGIDGKRCTNGEGKEVNVMKPVVAYGAVCDANLGSWMNAPDFVAGGPFDVFALAMRGTDVVNKSVVDSSQSDQATCLDIDLFFSSLLDRSICLGRTAGFRRVDVDEVLKRCVIKQ